MFFVVNNIIAWAHAISKHGNMHKNKLEHGYIFSDNANRQQHVPMLQYRYKVRQTKQSQTLKYIDN